MGTCFRFVFFLFLVFVCSVFVLFLFCFRFVVCFVVFGFWYFLALENRCRTLASTVPGCHTMNATPISGVLPSLLSTDTVDTQIYLSPTCGRLFSTTSGNGIKHRLVVQQVGLSFMKSL